MTTPNSMLTSRVLLRRPAWLVAFLGALVLAPLAATAAPVKIILDVDLAEDVDDAGALAVLHALAHRGEAEILGVLVSSKNEWVGPCVDAINTWHGRPDLPIGYQRSHQYGYRNQEDAGRDTGSKYAEAVAQAFPHDLQRSRDAPDAARLCRKLLAAQPDGSVTIVTVGFLTNLRDLHRPHGVRRTGADQAGEDHARRRGASSVEEGSLIPNALANSRAG